MRILIGLIILALAACALLTAHQHKPFPLFVDASANRVEMADQYACIRLLTPYRVTTEPKPIVRT